MPEVGVSLALRRHQSLLGSSKSRDSRGGSSRLSNKIGDRNGSLSDRNHRRTEEWQQSPLHNQRSPARIRRRPSGSSNSTSTENGDQRDATSSISSGNRRRRRPSRQRQPLPISTSSWQLLLEMSALYGFCMILPSLLRISIRFYLSCWEPGGILFQLSGSVCTVSWLSRRLQWCHHFLPDSYYDKSASSTSTSSSSVLAPDAGLSDVAIVISLSMTMAVVRVLLVHFLVPNYKQPKRLEALVRCKSIHLLSSQYPASITPRASFHKKRSLLNSNDASSDDAILQLPGLAIPNLHADDVHDDEEDSSETAHSRARHDDDDDDHNASPQSIGGSSLFHTPRMEPTDPLRRHDGPATWALDQQERKKLLQHQHDNDNSSGNWGLYEDGSDYDYENDDASDNEHENPAPAVSSGILTSSSAQNLLELLEQAAPSRGRLSRNSSFRSNKENSNNSDQRVFAAPKYATAVFRLLFCCFSCLVGLYFFGGADFWPPAVGGSGTTKNCWDLSSVGAAVMDSDFDQRNSVLRRYYLLQASYHFHSAAFHVLTSLLLWFVSKQSKNKESSSRFFLGFIPAGMFTLYNLKTFFQHCFSIVLILVTYLFSSTRRLGAIAMFTFDASSLFLHLLQLGINAPRKPKEAERQAKRSWPASMYMLHRLVVIPAFCYARFFVFPFVIAFSALEESQDWLRQLENMLIPGTAQYIHGFFVVAFLLFLVMNMVYFLRLLNHPHVMAPAMIASK